MFDCKRGKLNEWLSYNNNSKLIVILTTQTFDWYKQKKYYTYYKQDKKVWCKKKDKKNKKINAKITKK